MRQKGKVELRGGDESSTSQRLPENYGPDDGTAFRSEQARFLFHCYENHLYHLVVTDIIRLYFRGRHPRRGLSRTDVLHLMHSNSGLRVPSQQVHVCPIWQ